MRLWIFQPFVARTVQESCILWMVIESAWPTLKETWQQTKAIWELPCLIIYFLFVDTLSLQLAARQIFQKQNHLSNLQQMPGRLMKREVLPPGPPPAINTNKARPSLACLMLALGSIDYVVRELWEGCLCDRNIFKKLTTESSRKESGTPWLHNIMLQILGSKLSRKKRPRSCSCRLRGIFCEVLISQDRIGCLQPTVLPETSGNSGALGAVKVCDIF